MPARLDHAAVVTADLERAAAFYDAVLGAAGWERVVAFQDFEDEDEVGEEAVGYGEDDVARFWLVAGRVATRGLHLSVRVDDVATVDAVAAAGGATPRHRDRDRPGSYGVIVTDPDGNTVEVFALG